MHAQRGVAHRGLPDQVGIGDVLMCGPNMWGVHHMSLCTSAMRSEVKLLPNLDVGPDIEAFSCTVIECSTEFADKGETPWFRSRKYFTRNKVTGEAMFIGFYDTALAAVQLKSALPAKLLLHPMRSCSGESNLGREAFLQALTTSIKTGSKWSLAAAAKAFTNAQHRLHPDDYPDIASREALLDELRQSWLSGQICTSVIITVWQRYFEIISGGEHLPAVQLILRWMPVLSDNCLPSGLIEVLTPLGWQLRWNFDKPVLENNAEERKLPFVKDSGSGPSPGKLIGRKTTLL